MPNEFVIKIGDKYFNKFYFNGKFRIVNTGSKNDAPVISTASEAEALAKVLMFYSEEDIEIEQI